MIKEFKTRTGAIGWDDGATRTNTNAKMVTEKITHILIRFINEYGKSHY